MMNPPTPSMPIYQPRPFILELLIPPAVVPLFGLLALVLPIFLLTAKSLLFPVWEWFHSLLLPVNAGVPYAQFSLLLLIKLVLFGIFGFIGVKLLLLKVLCTYYDIWSRSVDRPSSNHASYHASPLDSLVALFNWTLYRWTKVLGPLIGYSLLLMFILSLAPTMFNIVGGYLPILIEFIALFFIGGLLVGCIGLQLAKSIVLLFKTLLAEPIAITEPELATELVFKRSCRLALNSPWSMVLYPVYALFLLLLGFELTMLFSQFDIHNLIQFSFDLVILFSAEALTLLFFIVLKALTFLTYHDALTRFYSGQSALTYR